MKMCLKKKLKYMKINRMMKIVKMRQLEKKL